MKIKTCTECDAVLPDYTRPGMDCEACGATIPDPNVKGYDDNPESGNNVIKGWPGDGSGLDDFQDANANEADDYRDE